MKRLLLNKDRKNPAAVTQSVDIIDLGINSVLL